MKVKIKKLHPDAKMPTRGSEHSACFDLYATETVTMVGRQIEGVKVPTGLAFEIPNGYCGIVYSRSSLALKAFNITPLVVESDYRGELFVIVRPDIRSNEFVEIQKGERVGQIMIQKLEPTEFEWAEELSKTNRGTNGYGSTGK